MTPLLAIVAVLSGPPAVTFTGGNPAQSLLVSQAIDSVPACLKSCSKDVPQIFITGGSANAIYYRGSDGKSPRIDVAQALIDDTPETEEWMEKVYTNGPDEMHPYFSNLDSWMLHEYTHHWDVTCNASKDGKRLADSFLKIRFDGMKKALAADAEYQKLIHAYIQVGGRPDYLSAGEYDTRRKLVTKLDAMRAKYRVPQRHRGDTHSLDGDLGPGTEYLAIAVQTLVYQPDVFCKSYSPDEIAWMHDHMGSCLATMPKLAPCYTASGSPATRGPVHSNFVVR